MFKTLKELLLVEEEDIVDGASKALAPIKKGYDKAIAKHKEQVNKRKDAEREVERKQKEAERKAEQAVKAEKTIADKASKEAEAAAKATAAEHKLKSAESMQALRGDLDGFITSFFDRFPFHDSDVSAESILEKYPTREAAVEAFKAFKGLSDRVDALLKGFTTGLLTANKITKEQARRYAQQAARVIKKETSTTPAIPPALIKFVRAESKFFKRLIKIDDDFKLDDDDFKSLLTMKIKQTDPARVPDATQALTLLFTYMSAEFRAHARTIADAGRSLDDENVAAKRATRDAAAATAAGEVEARAKTTGT